MFITSILAHSEEKTSIQLNKVTHVVQYNPKILEIFFVNEKSILIYESLDSWEKKINTKKRKKSKIVPFIQNTT